jgi:hypothetical protein
MVIDDNSEIMNKSMKKRELILNMKAIGNYNDLKYRRMPAKGIKLFSESGVSNQSASSPPSSIGRSK